MKTSLIRCSEASHRWLKREAAARGMNMDRLMDEIIQHTKNAMPPCLPMARVNASKETHFEPMKPIK